MQADRSKRSNPRHAAIFTSLVLRDLVVLVLLKDVGVVLCYAIRVILEGTGGRGDLI